MECGLSGRGVNIVAYCIVSEVLPNLIIPDTHVVSQHMHSSLCQLPTGN